MPLYKIIGDDLWNPNNWVPDDHEFRIYTKDPDVYAIVDFEDYCYLSQFLWSIHNTSKPNHPYLRRSLHIGQGPSMGYYESPITGKIVRDKQRSQRTMFLHQEVMLRKNEPRPTPEHKEPDHIDRNVLNCRRNNLRWATRSEQVRNSINAARFGYKP